jgi:hemolysin III
VIAGRTDGQPAAPAVRDDEQRPLMRGTLHLAAAMLAPFGLVLLLMLADSPRRYVGASIFATSLLLLYASSASYHMVPWPARLRSIMMRVDHSMIFVLIAGTYTPFCLVILDYSWGIPMLAIVWTLAGTGVLMKVLWPRAPRWLSVGLYLGIGWMGVIPASQVQAGLPAPGIVLLVLGGVLYSSGAVMYGLQRPNPFPRVFGFHEVFHVFVIAGSVAHFILVARYVIG